MNRNVEYTVIPEKMLGSWLPKCNNLYIIYQRGSLLNIVCARKLFEMKKVKFPIPAYTHFVMCIQKGAKSTDMHN